MYDTRTVAVCAVLFGPFFALLVLSVFVAVWNRLFSPPEDES